MSATPELACLVGTRAVMTTEVDEGSYFSESLIKQMTGGDPIPARHLYSPPFEYKPTYKLLIAGNHKANIRGGDDGIWRRINLIPFEVTIPAEKRDPKLADKLRDELPGILAWALRGCLAWQADGLRPPVAVTDAVGEYKEEMDILGQWLSESCELGADFTISAAAAYNSYNCWAGNSAGLKPWSKPLFGRKLKERFASRRKAGGIEYCGFRLPVPRVSSGPPIIAPIAKHLISFAAPPPAASGDAKEGPIRSPRG